MIALTDQQIAVGDLIMGLGTEYRWLSTTNPLDVQVRTSGGGPRSQAHGTWGGQEWLDERVIAVEFLIDEPTQAAALESLERVTAVFTPATGFDAEVPFRFRWAGRDRLIYVRPRGLTPDLDLMSTGRIFCRAGLVALNPVVYDGTETVIGPISPPVVTGGLTFPLVFPLVFNVVTVGGSAGLSNTGLHETGMIIRFDGPSQNPIATFALADGTVTQIGVVDVTLAAGEWLELDTAAATAFQNGVTNRRGNLTGEWVMLPPGDHTVGYRAANSAGSSMTIRYRSAWR